jgi:hypothetical protein
MLTTPEATPEATPAAADDDAGPDLGPAQRWAGEPLDPAIVAALPLQGRAFVSPACEVSPEAEEALLAPWRAAFAARGLEVQIKLARVMAARTYTEQGRRGPLVVTDMDRAVQHIGVHVWRVWVDKTHPRPISDAHPELTVKTHQERVLVTLERAEGVPLWRLWLGTDTGLVPFDAAVEVIATRPPSWARTSELARRFAADSEKALEAKIKARQEAEADKAAKKAAKAAEKEAKAKARAEKAAPVSPPAPTNKTKPGRAGGR